MAEEYIAREELLKGLREAGGDGGIGNLVAGVLELYVKSVPAADVAPVVHGRWEFKHPNGWACSNCGEWGLMIDNRGICKSNYCPNCGAKMDLEE